MSGLKTYQGIIREGNIHLPPATSLPEGNYVYVVIAGDAPLIEEKEARRAATRWLVEHVGYMLVADEGRLMEANGQIIWRFAALVTAQGSEPQGPLGFVTVDAQSGTVLTTGREAEQIIAHGEAFIRTLPSPN
jgi:hypothetical protein